MYQIEQSLPPEKNNDTAVSRERRSEVRYMLEMLRILIYSLFFDTILPRCQKRIDLQMKKEA